MEGETLVVSVNATTQPYAYPGRAAETVPPLERSRRLNTVLLVIIAMLLMFGALGGTYLYGIVSNLSSTTGAAGAPGNNGAPGSDGSDGSNGANGPAGFPGPVGSDGRNGSDGQDGLDGAAGLDGADGVDGVDGAILYNSGQGVLDLGACDSEIGVSLRSRLVGDDFYLATITLSEISSDCYGSTLDVFALGGSAAKWTTLTEAIGVEITDKTLVIGVDQLTDEVLSADIVRIALEIR